LPDFGSTGIIFYTGGIQWSQREIFPSLVATDHGIFASKGSTLKMHLLSDNAVKVSPAGKHLPYRKNQTARRAIAFATRGEERASRAFSQRVSKAESTRTCGACIVI
jgi:hypothetical protein